VRLFAYLKNWATSNLEYFKTGQFDFSAMSYILEQFCVKLRFFIMVKILIPVSYVFGVRLILVKI